MKERPILFSGPMVRALLEGSKTQTRRVVKPQFATDAIPCEMGATNERGHQISGHSGMWWCDAEGNHEKAVRCPYGKPGDRLWVRETWSDECDHHWVMYRADHRAERRSCGEVFDACSADELRTLHVWSPSIHMPRWASRITLEITGVRVERLQDICEADAIAEGCAKNHNNYYWGGPHKAGGLKQMATARQAYQDLWESINGPGSWDANPWVWVVAFKRVEGGAA